mmetsp:Transcript_58792/g.105230  ORF Transcript_58792/g.105230 Transcript_58792/m.105230 type:complete len:89 (-) Transcript_58792:835-1101(-)
MTIMMMEVKDGLPKQSVICAAASGRQPCRQRNFGAVTDRLPRSTPQPRYSKDTRACARRVSRFEPRKNDSVPEPKKNGSARFSGVMSC